MASYGATARLLHWLTVLFVLSTLPVGAIMVREGLSRPVQDALFIYHKNVGVILLRLAWRLMRPPPPLPARMPALQARMAHAVHLGLYAMLLFMAITGYVRVVAGGFPIELLDWLGVPPLLPRMDNVAETASLLHFRGKFVLIALIVLHVGAALWHGLIKRDGVLGRMWPPLGRARG